MMRLFAARLLLAAWMLGITVASRDKGRHWVGTWTSMPQEVEVGNLAPPPFGGEDVPYQFRNSTIRQTLRTSIRAERIRIRISNVFGKTPLPITAASVALPLNGNSGVGEIDGSSTRRLTFEGSASTTIGPGEFVDSDPVHFRLPPLSNLALSIYLEDGQLGNKITGHPGSRTTSWMGTGNLVNASSVSEASTRHWYFVSAVETWAPRNHYSIVLLGDSITDGRGSEDDRNNRWSDFLAARLQVSRKPHIAVNNQAAGGNAVLSGGLGPPLLHRYHRDALQQNGARYVLVFEGVNDIGTSPTDDLTQRQLTQRLINAYAEIVTACKKANMRTIGATITPFTGSQYGDVRREETRLEVNDWILNNGTFDYVVDFASVIGDGDKLRPEFDSGDHLHPNVDAYREMGSRFPVHIFE
ncbi:hypothetical protein CDV36_013627 [Fusarium kuroshium]|uniref:SGNH hydrolase-type esterase domain-containing protein n=1 Tax=Fusarium kuroshium TaxID=2010991 RepID=A0A3M2RNH1_9HYPO|nr:hypothetical protein CDV36_013627 [Fusarium kuroshium]